MGLDPEAYTIHELLKPNGHMVETNFFQLFSRWKYQLSIVISFVHLKNICNFAKLQGCGMKTKPVMPIRNLN